MNTRCLAVLMFQLCIPCLAHGQCSLQERQAGADQTKAKGYWTDPCTGLTWAATDNGKVLIWQHAVKYCRNLRLAGHADWRLGSLSELRNIFDKNVRSDGINPASHWHGEEPMGYHILGGLFLHGHQWSNGNGQAQKEYWDFLNGGHMGVDSSMIFGLFSVANPMANALCVRGPDSLPPKASATSSSLKLNELER